MMSKLSKSFYRGNNVVKISKNLLGKILFTKIENEITAGIITETEAYEGATDKASHAYANKRTKRTEIMFQNGGVAYVYLCYGIHSLFNVVTNKNGIPHAVLIRGIKPIEGIETILKRRGKNKIDKNICMGPGKLSQALGIKTEYSGISLCENTIWIEDSDLSINENDISLGKRIGVDYAKEDADLLYRFTLKI